MDELLTYRAFTDIEFNPDKLYQHSLSEPKGTVVKLFDEMKDGATFCGKIRLNYSVQEVSP